MRYIILFEKIANYLYTYIHYRFMRCGKCGYEWDYQGNSNYYTSCPRCRSNIRVGDGVRDGNNNKTKK